MTGAAHSPDPSLSSWVPPLLLVFSDAHFPCPLPSPAGILSWDLEALLTFGISSRAEVHTSEPWSRLCGGEEHPGVPGCVLSVRKGGWCPAGSQGGTPPSSSPPHPPSPRVKTSVCLCGWYRNVVCVDGVGWLEERVCSRQQG